MRVRLRRAVLVEATQNFEPNGRLQRSLVAGYRSSVRRLVLDTGLALCLALLPSAPPRVRWPKHAVVCRSSTARRRPAVVDGRPVLWLGSALARPRPPPRVVVPRFAVPRWPSMAGGLPSTTARRPMGGLDSWRRVWLVCLPLVGSRLRPGVGCGGAWVPRSVPRGVPRHPCLRANARASVAPG